MKILVCGGRDYSDKAKVYEELDFAHNQTGIEVIIQGGARGADELGKQWALDRSVPMKEYRADWNKHGKAAGPIRNKQMLEEGKPDWVYAFAGGRGTADMVRQSKAAGVKVREIGIFSNRTQAY